MVDELKNARKVHPLKRLLKVKRITQEAIAESIGSHGPVVNRCLNGSTSPVWVCARLDDIYKKLSQEA